MKKLWAVIKQHYEFIAYIGLTILLLYACFYPVFAWIGLGYVVVFALLLHHESKLVGLLMYLHCFYTVFNYQKILGITLDIVIVGFFVSFILILYLYRLIKREQKLNWKTLIPLGLFLVYVVLPFHECYWQDFFAMVFFFVILYVVFEERQKIDFCYVVRAFTWGLIISCAFALLRDVSPLLTEKIKKLHYFGQFRFSGLSFHPNDLASLVVLAITAILIMKHKNKISLLEFVVMFVPLFIFGYLTISRAFIVTIAAGIIVFAVIDFCHRKFKALVLVSIMLAAICVAGGLFHNITKIYLERISANSIDSAESAAISTTSFDEILGNYPEDYQQGVLAGEIYFDPGRSSLRGLYLSDWSSSAKTIWLGRGISRPLIGKMSAHNLFIQELWKHGIVGYMFYLVIILCSINWKKLKRLLDYVPALIMLLPYFLTTLIEQCLYDYDELIMIILACGFLGQISNNQKQLIESRDEPKLTETN